jgi:hypothetical protein
MSYKTILTPLMFEETAKPQLESALQIAGAFHAHVHAKHVRQKYTYYPPVSYYPMAPESMVVSDEANEAAADELAKKLRGILMKRVRAQERTSWHWMKRCIKTVSQFRGLIAMGSYNRIMASLAALLISQWLRCQTKKALSLKRQSLKACSCHQVDRY